MRGLETRSWMKQLRSSSRQRQGRHAHTLHLFFTRLCLQPSVRGTVDPYPAIVPCAHLADVATGRLIHALGPSRCHRLARHVRKCGLIVSAHKVFDEMPVKDLVVWNTLLAGYARHGLPEQALALSVKMRGLGQSPDMIWSPGMPLYLVLRWQVMTEWPAIWFCLFDRMLREGVKPNHLTFTAVLTACSYGGMVETGKAFYRAMREEYCAQPRLEHYACMVHLLGGAGRYDEAHDFIKVIPVEPDWFIWEHRLVKKVKKGVAPSAKLG